MKAETESFYRVAVQRAVQRVAASLDESLDLQALARGAALSPFHFHRVFRGFVGETPLELHRRLRLERAAFCLLNESSPVTALAFAAGYETHEAFTRAFRAHYGCSPSELRQSRSSQRAACERPTQIELAAPSGLHFDPCATQPQFVVLNEGVPVMNVEIKHMPELRAACVQHVGSYTRISEAFGRLGDIAGRAGLLDAKPTMLAVYHDDPETTAESALRSDAAIVIGDGTPLPEGLNELRLPAGRYACMLHVGPYEELGDAWARLLGQWLPHSGERGQDGDSYEIYLNNPTDVAKSELRTELYMPLASG